jgi:hypothetical protein
MYITGTIHTLSVHYDTQQVYKTHRGPLSVQACATSCALTYSAVPKRQLVTSTVIGLTVTKFKYSELIENESQSC